MRHFSLSSPRQHQARKSLPSSLQHIFKYQQEGRAGTGQHTLHLRRTQSEAAGPFPAVVRRHGLLCSSCCCSHDLVRSLFTGASKSSSIIRAQCRLTAAVWSSTITAGSDGLDDLANQAQARRGACRRALHPAGFCCRARARGGGRARERGSLGNRSGRRDRACPEASLVGASPRVSIHGVSWVRSRGRQSLSTERFAAATRQHRSKCNSRPECVSTGGNHLCVTRQQISLAGCFAQRRFGTAEAGDQVADDETQCAAVPTGNSRCRFKKSSQGTGRVAAGRDESIR